MPLFVPAYKSFQHYHMPHHSYISIDLDEINKAEMNRNKKKKPMYDPDLPSALEARIFTGSPLHRLSFLFMQVVLYAVRPLFTAPRVPLAEDYICLLT